MAKAFTRKMMLNSPSGTDPLNMMDHIEPIPEEGTTGGNILDKDTAELIAKKKKKDHSFGFDILKLD
jgi:hypothetical protein